MKLNIPVFLLLSSLNTSIASPNSSKTKQFPRNLSNICDVQNNSQIAQMLVNYGLQDKGYSVTANNNTVEITCTTDDACKQAENIQIVLLLNNLTSDSCKLNITKAVANTASCSQAKNILGLAVLGAAVALG